MYRLPYWWGVTHLSSQQDQSFSVPARITFISNILFFFSNKTIVLTISYPRLPAALSTFEVQGDLEVVKIAQSQPHAYKKNVRTKSHPFSHTTSRC